MAEADLIKRDDSEFCGQRRNYRIPNACVVRQTVNQNQWSAAPCFDIMNPRAINCDELVDFGRCFPSFLRRGMPWTQHDREQADQENKSEHQTFR